MNTVSDVPNKPNYVVKFDLELLHPLKKLSAAVAAGKLIEGTVVKEEQLKKAFEADVTLVKFNWDILVKL